MKESDYAQQAAAQQDYAQQDYAQQAAGFFTKAKQQPEVILECLPNIIK